jgi:hypothetical protein
MLNPQDGGGPNGGALQTCPFCRERIQRDAVKCRYCGSSLLPPQSAAQSAAGMQGLEPNQVLLVLDRGLLYFAKFIGAVVIVILAVTTAFFGLDLNRAREDVDKMRSEVQRAQEEVQSAKKEIESAKTDVAAIGQGAQQLLAEAKSNLADTKSLIDRILTTAKTESDTIHSLLVSIHLPAAPQERTISPPRDLPTIPARTSRPWFTVPEITRLYNFPTDLDGSGQVIGILEFGGGYSQHDIDTYFQKLGLPVPDITAVSVNGHTNRPADDPGSSGQVELDIEVIGAIASRAKIRVYFSDFHEKGIIDAINSAVTDGVTIINCSWGYNELQFDSATSFRAGDVKIINGALKAAAEQNVTVVVGTGDDGARAQLKDGRPHVDFPASSPWVLAIGGTRLVASGDSIRSETAWNDGPDSATGGGFSEMFDRPEWQSGSLSKELGSTAGRGIPDVTAVADPLTGYFVVSFRYAPDSGRNVCFRSAVGGLDRADQPGTR